MGPVSRFAPPLAIMALIFGLSAQPGLDSGLGAWDLLLRKAAHIGIYALLWLAVARALDWRQPVLTTVIVLAYAVSDEFHQSFVTDRHGSPVDVGIDSVGMVLAALAWAVMTRRRPAAAT